MNQLYNAYIRGDSNTDALFARRPETLLTSVQRVGNWPDGITEAINRMQNRLGGTNSRISGDEMVIITGQQTGLFTGPLYTLYKAVTALKLAKHFQATGNPCVPVFWAAGDDHDFEETRHAHFLTKRHELLTLSYTPRDMDAVDMPMYRIPADGQIHDLIDAAAAACRGGENAEDIKAFLHESLDEADSLADWFGRLLARLFSNTELRIFLPWDQTVRKAAAPVLEREIRNPLVSTQLLLEQGRLIESFGYPAVIQRRENACNFFVEQDGRRCNVFFKDNRFHIAGTREPLTTDDMLSLLDASPERFSPNVALRPVIQQQLFPAIAYVAGPGEVAYWAQLKPLFAFFEKPMPIVYPRIQCVIKTIKAGQLMRRYGLDAFAIMNNDDLLVRALRADAANPRMDAFARHRSVVADTVSQMASDLGAKDADAAQAVARFQRDTLAGLDKLERQLLRSDKEKRRTVDTRIERLRAEIAPLNKPQERVLSVFSFLFEHGWPLIARMTDELELDCFALQEMEL